MQKSDPKKRLEELDAVISALAHPSRRHILMVVRFRGGTMTAGEIAERFGCTWPTTSRHLRVLEQAGLLVHEKHGRTRAYSVNSAKLEIVKDWLDWFELRGSSNTPGALPPDSPSKAPNRRVKTGPK